MILLLVKKKNITDGGRLKQKSWRGERGFQERKKTETLNLGKNLLTPYKKFTIFEFERKSSGKSVKVNGGSGGIRNC